VRIVCLGRLPGTQVNNVELGRELYDGQKNSFLTISGHTITEQLDIVDAQAEINTYHKAWKKTLTGGESALISFSSEFIENIDEQRISEKTWQLILGEGPMGYPSNSEKLLGVCIDLLEAGLSVDEILTLCTDDCYEISMVAGSRRPNNRESQRVWIANYSLAKAMAIYNERQALCIDIDALVLKAKPVVEVVKNPEPDRFPVPILNDLMEWMETLDEQPTRAITMQGVIAANAVLAGRIYKSENANDSSLFTITLAPTGQGKGYPAKAIKTLFNAAGLGGMIKGPGNTSASGVFSALRESPCHIQISDEIGKQYQAARKQQNGMLAEAFAQLTIAYSDTDSVMYPRNFSTEGLTKAQLDNRGDRFIVNPSCTMFSFATFEQVFNNLTMADIDDGFLNRQIIVNADGEQLPERDRGKSTPPIHLVEWCKSMRRKNVIGTKDNNVQGLDTAYNLAPAHIEVMFAKGVKEMFKEFKKEAKQEEGDRLKMAIRWNENAMRMATGFAVAENQINPVVSPTIAAWCIHYVRYHGERFFVIAEQNIADNDVHRLRNQVYQALENAGQQGRTEGELTAYCRMWPGATLTQRDQVLESLKREGLIIEVKPGMKTGRGRKPKYSRFYSCNFVNFDDES